MFHKNRAFFYYISLFLFSFALSTNIFFSSLFWKKCTIYEKILEGTTFLLLFIFVIFLIQKLAAPFFLNWEIRKKSFWILISGMLLFTAVITWSDFYFFPHALQPQNFLQIQYKNSETVIHPSLTIYTFNKKNIPEIFNGTEAGIPGFAELKRIDDQQILEGSTNFRGYAVLDIPVRTRALITSILWNDEPVDFSTNDRLILPASNQLLARQSHTIRFVTLVLLVAKFITHFLILGAVTTFMLFTIDLFTNLQIIRYFRNWQLLYLFMAGLLCFSPQFSYHATEKILFFVWTISCSVLLQRWKNSISTGKYQTKKIHFLLIITAFILSFQFFGNRTLILNQTSILLPAENILFFITAALWLIPSIFCLLIFLELLYEKSKKKSETGNLFLTWFLFFGFFILIFALYLIAYNPAISSMDSQGQWWQAVGETPIDDAHTPFHTLYLRFLIGIVPSPLFIAIIQILLFAAVSSSFLTWLNQRGIPKYLLTFFVILFSILPNNGLSVITIWKDIPYGISFLWLTLILSRIASDQKSYLRKITIIPEITVSLLCVCLFRYNGLLPGLAVAIYILVTGIRKRNTRLVIPVILSSLLYWIITGPIYRSIPVIPIEFGKNTLDRIMVNDMIGVERIGGTLSAETSQLLNQITGNYRDVPYSHYEIDNTWKQNADWTRIDSGTIPLYYGKTIVTNPVHFLRTFLLRTEFIWAVKQIPSGGFIDSIIWRDADIFGFPRIVTPLIGVLDAFCQTSILDPFFIFIWRIGIHIGLIITACIFLEANHRRSLIWAALPFWMDLISLSGVTFPSYRYIWPNEVTSGFLLLFFVIPLQNDQSLLDWGKKI